ncbi:MAG TPA: hypothetical protein VF837_04360 [Patescibacteria group bacterium]
MKKVHDPGFTPFSFTCPRCKCEYEIEDAADIELKYDEGSPFLMVVCPECDHPEGVMRLSSEMEKAYLPLVQKAKRQLARSGIKVVKGATLRRALKNYCDSCHCTVEVTTTDPIKWWEGLECYYVICPDCGNKITFRGRSDDSSVIAEAFLSIH